MENHILLVLGTLIAVFFIAYFTGNLPLAIIIPSCAAGIFIYWPLFSENAYRSIGLVGIIVLFLMVSIGYGVFAGVGSLVGDYIRKKSKTNQWSNLRLVSVVGILIITLVGTASALIVRERKSVSWSAMVESAGRDFIRQQNEVISEVGPIVDVTIFSKSIKFAIFGKSIDQGTLIYSIGGPQGEAQVMVGIAGTLEKPEFTVKSTELIPHSMKHPLR